MNDGIYIAISLALVVLFLIMNAFFVVAEFALVRVRKSQLELSVTEGKRGAEAALKIAENVNAYLSACQLGITLASLALGWLGEPAFSELIRPLFELFGAPEAVISVFAVAIGYFIMTTLHVVVGELIPKSLAIFSTERYALATARALILFYKITFPIMWLFNTITNGVVRALGHDPANEHEVYTGDEIKLLLDESTESGLIDPEANEYVDNVLDLGDKDAEAIMTPRTDVIFLDTESTLDDVMATIKQYKYTRYPICRGSKDHVLGFVHIKDLYALPADTPMGEWRLREMVAVPETAGIAAVINALEAARTEICLVVDEHGGTAGIVTFADVMEQIMGRIDDEYRHDTGEDIVAQADGTYILDGGMPAADLEELLGFMPPRAAQVETAAGVVLALLDRIPDVGDTASADFACATKTIHATFTIVSMDKRRIDKIRLALDIEFKGEGEEKQA